jgi:hypothetical protein
MKQFEGLAGGMLYISSLVLYIAFPPHNQRPRPLDVQSRAKAATQNRHALDLPPMIAKAREIQKCAVAKLASTVVKINNCTEYNHITAVHH